jgi:hypothetical protein
MNRSLLVSVSLLALLACDRPGGSTALAATNSGTAAASALRPADKSLDQVLQGYAAARGGRDKLDAIKTVRMKGRMSSSRGADKAPITIEKKRAGSKFLRLLEPGGMKVIQAVDGEQAWELSPPSGVTSPRIMPEPVARRFYRWRDIEGPLVDPAGKGHKVELLGIQKLDGGEAYRLKVQYKDGDVSFYLLDTKTLLPTQVVDLTERKGEVLEATTVYKDYRKSGGVLWPFSEETTVGDLTQSIVWEQVEVDVPLDDAHFKMQG